MSQRILTHIKMAVMWLAIREVISAKTTARIFLTFNLRSA